MDTHSTESIGHYIADHIIPSNHIANWVRQPTSLQMQPEMQRSAIIETVPCIVLRLSQAYNLCTRLCPDTRDYLRTRDCTDQQLEHDHSKAPQVACCVIHDGCRQAGDGRYELRCAVLRRAVLVQQVLCVHAQAVRHAQAEDRLHFGQTC